MSSLMCLSITSCKQNAQNQPKPANNLSCSSLVPSFSHRLCRFVVCTPGAARRWRHWRVQAPCMPSLNVTKMLSLPSSSTTASWARSRHGAHTSRYHTHRHTRAPPMALTCHHAHLDPLLCADSAATSASSNDIQPDRAQGIAGTHTHNPHPCGVPSYTRVHLPTTRTRRSVIEQLLVVVSLSTASTAS